MAGNPDFQNLKLRIVALEKEAMLALATPVTVDASTLWRYVGEGFPYFKNRGERFGLGSTSEELDAYTLPMIARLVIGHVTAGYEGENDDNLDLYIPHIIKYVNERELLQSAAYPEAPDYLERAGIIDCTYYREFQDTGIGGVQIGTEFTISCKFTYEIVQAYL